MHPLPAGRPLLAFSGGSDSVGLAERVRDSDPLLAYVDHRLRGPRASRLERAHVLELARRLGLELVRVRVTPADGSEAAARAERYRCLAALSLKHGCCGIATAHTADDRAETVLFNLLRGSGLRGLAAPRPRIRIGKVLRLRPALDERRAFIRGLAEPFECLDDPSNRSTGFSRSRTRHLLLPALESLLAEDPVPLLCAIADAADAVRTPLEDRAAALAPLAGRAEFLREPAATFAYLVEALRPAGPPLTARAYDSLRAFLAAGRTGRAHRTPGGECWCLGQRGALKVTAPRSG